MVRLEGFEPPTLGSVDRCSNPLSYSRVLLVFHPSRLTLSATPAPYHALARPSMTNYRDSFDAANDTWWKFATTCTPTPNSPSPSTARPKSYATDSSARLGPHDVCPTDTGAVATARRRGTGTTCHAASGHRRAPRARGRGLLVHVSQYKGRYARLRSRRAHRSLLGVADVLARRGDLRAIHLVFQPAEEGRRGQGHDRRRLLNRAPGRRRFGAHVTSLAPVGLVATRPGIFMSEADSLHIEIGGKGGHGAMATRRAT